MYPGRIPSSSRGPWRGARGRSLPTNSRGRNTTWNKGKEPVSKDIVDDSPRGRLLTEITLDNASGYGSRAENAKISDCRYAASYSLVDSDSPKIIIPGEGLQAICHLNANILARTTSSLEAASVAFPASRRPWRIPTGSEWSPIPGASHATLCPIPFRYEQGIRPFQCRHHGLR